MTHIATAGATPPADIPQVEPLTQAQKDAALKAVEPLLGAEIAGMIERNFQNRGELIAAQNERTSRALSAMAEYQSMANGQRVMGHLFQAVATAGRKGASSMAEATSDLLEKAVGFPVSKTLNVADAAEGGVFIEGTLLENWLEPLRAQAVVLSLNPTIVPVIGNHFKVDGFITDPSIVWVEEVNRQAATSTPTTGLRETPMRKALSILPITLDWRESVNPRVLQMLETMMGQAFTTGKDLEYLTGDGLENRIFGLRTLIEPATASAGNTFANALADLRTMINSVELTNVPVTNFGIIMNPRDKNHLMFLQDGNGHPFFMEEMRRGTIFGWPYRATTSIPTNLGAGNDESYYLGVAMNQVLIGDSGGLRLQWFQNASYTDAGALRSTVEEGTEILVGTQRTAMLMPHRNAGHITTECTYGT